MKKIVLAVFLTYLTFLCGFITGYLLFKSINQPKVSTSISTKFLNSKLALEDTDIVIVTKDSPHKIFHINHLINRREDYYQAQLVYSLNGNDLMMQMIPVDNISITQLTNSKNNKAYSLSGSFNIGNKDVTFNIPYIDLNMTVRAQSEVGKFAGATKEIASIIKVGDTDFNGYAGVTAGYFNKYEPVDLSDYKVKTNWLMYWDKDFNFYHLDVSQMENSSADYYPHNFLAQIQPSENVVRYINDFSIIRLSQDNYIISDNTQNLGEIDLNVLSSIKIYSKAESKLVTSDDGGIGILIDLDATR